MFNRLQSGATIAPAPVSNPPSLDFNAFAPPPARELDMRRLWKTLLRRRGLFLAIWIGFALAVAIFTLVQPRSYMTQVKLIAGSANPSSAPQTVDAGTNLPILNALLAATGVQSSETYAELIQQVPVAQEVGRRVGIKIPPDKLLTHLQVRPVTNTAILSINVAWKDPATSAKIANAFAGVFVDRERELVAHQADSAISFLQKELPGAESRMRAAQEALSAYQVRTRIVDLPTQTLNNVNAAALLDAKQQTSQIEAAQARAQLATVNQELAQTPRTVEGNRTIAANPISGTLQTQIATLQVQLSAAQKQYTEDYPTVISLKSQLAEAKRELKAQPSNVTAGVSTIPNPVYQALTQQAATLQATIASSSAQARMLSSQVAQAQPGLDALPVEAHRITELQRRVKSAQNVYDALERKNQDALISRTTALSSVAITQAADPNVYSVTPNILFNILLGIVVGLVLAVTAVFLAQFFDDRLRTEEDVRERLGLPVLAQIPMLTDGQADTEEWMRPLSVEAFYQLVASLRYSSSTPPRTIAFTSADQGDGKSTVALNSAISMGLMKARVLIIDADLRRPSIHSKLHLSNEPGLSDVLVGVAKFESAVRTTQHPGVSVMTCGRAAPNPVGLLQSAGFERLLARARDNYDFVIVDGPALRSIVDGVVLGIKAEGVVLVVSSQQSETRAVRGAIDKLRAVEGIKLLGVVLNGTRPDRRETATNYYLGAGASMSLPAEAGD